MTDRQLTPLVESHKYDSIENEFCSLFIKLFQSKLSGVFDDVNVYGEPHLGSRALLKQYLVSQDLANFNTEILSDENLRYLVQSWRYLNPKRGTWFLETFVRLVWGNAFEISQLYCKKTGVYPDDCRSMRDIADDGGSLSDYFLTSRLRITLTGDTGYFATEIGRGLNKVVPARLAVVEIVRYVEFDGVVFIAMAGASYSIVTGHSKQPVIEST